MPSSAGKTASTQAHAQTPASDVLAQGPLWAALAGYTLPSPLPLVTSPHTWTPAKFCPPFSSWGRPPTAAASLCPTMYQDATSISDSLFSSPGLVRPSMSPVCQNQPCQRPKLGVSGSPHSLCPLNCPRPPALPLILLSILSLPFGSLLPLTGSQMVSPPLLALPPPNHIWFCQDELPEPQLSACQHYIKKQN